MQDPLASSWIRVEAEDEPDSPLASAGLCPSFCALPPLVPDFDGPPKTVSTMRACLRSDEDKAELHRVLQAVQCSAEFGIYFCENFRDPRKHYIDDYWDEVAHEAIGISDLHKLVGKRTEPLSDEARTRMHQFARLLERLARRIDRIVLAPQ